MTTADSRVRTIPAAIAEAFRQNQLSVRFARLPSLEGHDAFLVDIPRFDAEIRAFLA